MKIISILLLGVVLVAGCTASQIDLYLKASPAIQNFLSQYPNAKIATSLIGQGAVVSQIEEIKKECENFQVGSYYKTTINDESSSTELTVWMDAKTYQVVCAVKESDGIKQNIPQGTTTSETTTSSTTTSSSTTTTTMPPTTSSTTTSSSTTTTTAGCTSNSACGYKQICSNKKCVDVQCTNDSQCSGCKRCSGNSCVSCGSGPYGCYC